MGAMHHLAFRKKVPPALTGPRQAWVVAPRPAARHSSFSRERSRWWQGSSPPERRNLNPRMKTGSRVLDARLMASNFFIAQLRFLDNRCEWHIKAALRSART